MEGTMHPANEPFGIDARFPRPSRSSIWFLFAYPICVVADLLSGMHSPTMEAALGFAGIAWSVLFIIANTSTLRRRGYEAALRDFEMREFSDRGLAGTLPRREQEAFDMRAEHGGDR